MIKMKGNWKKPVRININTNFHQKTVQSCLVELPNIIVFIFSPRCPRRSPFINMPQASDYQFQATTCSLLSNVPRADAVGTARREFERTRSDFRSIDFGTVKFFYVSLLFSKREYFFLISLCSAHIVKAF